MSSTRRAPLLLLALLSVGCGPPRAQTQAPGAPLPTLATRSPQAADAPATANETTVHAQTISFADDADPEPTTQIQGAPRRPPLPRFRLFGTRANDGPN